MRHVINKDQITPFGHWIRQYGPQQGVTVTNLDYVVEDYRERKIMLIEEKSNGGEIAYGQKLTFAVLDAALGILDSLGVYKYHGAFVVQMPPGKDMPGPGTKVNGIDCTMEEIRDLLHFTVPQKVKPLRLELKTITGAHRILVDELKQKARSLAASLPSSSTIDIDRIKLP
jgi:hypothetical protein